MHGELISEQTIGRLVVFFVVALLSALAVVHALLLLQQDFHEEAPIAEDLRGYSQTYREPYEPDTRK